MAFELAAAIDRTADELERLAELPLAPAERLRRSRRVWLVGTGSSQHVAELGALLLAEAGLDARWASPSAFVRWLPPPRPDDGVIVISHTGSTAFARAAQRRAVEAGAAVLPLTGQGAGWSGAIETVAKERSETYSVSVTAALFVLARLAEVLGARLAVGDVVPRVRAALAEETVTVDPGARVVALAGSGPGGICAREGALKLREGAGVVAEGFEAEYLLHGSAVPLGAEDQLVLVQPAADPDDLVAGVGRAAGAAGLAVSTVAEPDGLHPLLAPIPLLVRLQRLALAASEARSADPDTVIRGPWADVALWKIGRPG